MDKNIKCGQLSKTNLMNELNQKNGLNIRLGLVDDKIIKKRIHAASYDLTPSIVAMSVKKGFLEKVYKSKSFNTNSYYIYVKPKDTVLIVSNEFISLPQNIAGYVTSRVSNVAYGFGHISTTIDPNWKGALLIALSNPSNHSLKVSVGTNTVEEANGIYTPINEPNTLATVTFHYLCSDSIENSAEYKSMRTDLLKNIRYDQKHTLISWLRKSLYHKRRRYTDYFFDYLATYEKSMITPKGWSDFLDEFSKVIVTRKHNKRTCANDFIIKENIFRRFIHFLNEHKKIIITLTVISIVLILSILDKYEIIEKDIIDWLVQWLINR